MSNIKYKVSNVYSKKYLFKCQTEKLIIKYAGTVEVKSKNFQSLITPNSFLYNAC